MRIVIFTGDENNGGIQQFTYTIVRAIAELDHQVNLFLPDTKKINVAEDVSGMVIRYHKYDTIFPKSINVMNIAEKIQALNPDVVLCTDDSIISCQVVGALSSGIKKCITMHDVLPHPARFSLRRKVVSILWRGYRLYGIKTSDNVILLSQNSHNRFQDYYSKYAEKAIVCPLGAHPPIGDDKCPRELRGVISKNFGLFFGRIDKYKGISRLLTAYQNAYEEDMDIPPLVIAGKGILTKEEEQLIDNNDNIYLINRFIENSEMLWILKNCDFVVLPYIEASQSGVLPLAYYFGKPVIASKISGLTEYVLDGKTGYLFEHNEKLKSLLLNSNIDWASMKGDCLAYYGDNLDWSHSIRKLINTIMGNNAG